MQRREFVQAAAVLLGAGTLGAGQALADTDDDEVYQTVLAEFDDVTAFKAPGAEHGQNGPVYLRLYDAASNTVAYATTDRSGDRLKLAVRDATGTALAA